MADSLVLAPQSGAWVIALHSRAPGSEKITLELQRKFIYHLYTGTLLAGEGQKGEQCPKGLDAIQPLNTRFPDWPFVLTAGAEPLIQSAMRACASGIARLKRTWGEEFFATFF